VIIPAQRFLPDNT